ncbi:FxSxx-COOH cyclophane-containing RiPP peptide [Frankia sp. AgKG'84/4]|uniref:FxSxx-COOH cyclophane-containing RiPP peptide n=1 Tax=Frankia sp. AgKG'84/4 TaxID=573490 RepID=UPI00200E1165|nr:FxSxx-COOH cyclophane-containing RiPP peptide [Frankia sp. AgKG'84/4]MCL9793424.1 FxSxx-COOH protein [Frankia sp. AgKG'84/4]
MEKTDDIVSEMVDLTRVNLDDLVLSDAGLAGESSTVLARSLRRLLRDVDAPGEALAGFQSSI